MSGTRRRRWLLRHAPEQLIEYPLEALLGPWGVLSGLPVALGLSRPGTLEALLPSWIVIAWGIALFVGGLTVTIGLARRDYGSVVARGAQLCAGACVCYGIAISATIGWGGLAAGGLLIVIGALLYLRAWWLRTRDDLHAEITAAAR